MTEKKIDLSISIVVYKDYLSAFETIKSIETFTNVNIKKIIYVIDNSNEKSDSKKRFLKKIKLYEDICFISTEKNLGFSKAHNLVIEKLYSKYHAIVNPDVILHEDSFEKIINFMELNQKDVGMVIPKIVDPNGILQLAYRRELTILDMVVHFFNAKLFRKRYDYHTMKEKNFDKSFSVPFGQGSFLVIQTSLFKKLNGFDERFFMYMEDADLCKRVNQVSKLKYFPNSVVEHKWVRGSHKNLKLLKIHIVSMVKYFQKWGIKLF
ncbi:glycosyltransferase [Liquorilactobacillus satsumensis]|nr:glycosyltransferase [Liquorilactobacillus satsumensis]